MKTEEKIIKLFIENKEQFTIREIAKKIGSDYRITHTAVQRLLQKKILVMKKVGKSSLCSLNLDYYGFEIYKAEEKRKERILKNKDIYILNKEIKEKIGTSFFIFLVFGSYAYHAQTKRSDIDLMFISNENNFEEKIDNILSLLPLKTHVLVFSEHEFKKMLYSKDLNVVKEAMKNYIILHGIENFYFLKNA